MVPGSNPWRHDITLPWLRRRTADRFGSAREVLIPLMSGFSSIGVVIVALHAKVTGSIPVSNEFNLLTVKKITVIAGGGVRLKI